MNRTATVFKIYVFKWSRDFSPVLRNYLEFVWNLIRQVPATLPPIRQEVWRIGGWRIGI